MSIISSIRFAAPPVRVQSMPTSGSPSPNAMPVPLDSLSSIDEPELAEEQAATPSPAEPQAPQPIKDGQGRVYYPATDANGNFVYTHHSSQPLPDGKGTFTLDIVLRPQENGALVRIVRQEVDRGSGTNQVSLTQTAFDTQGKVVAEQNRIHDVRPGLTQDETTNSMYTAGSETHRDTVLDKVQTQGALPADTVEAVQKIHAVWDANGKPIDESVIPTLELDETVKYINPGEGIYQDTPRILTTHRAAEGTTQKLTWKNPMEVSVKFMGRGDHYIQRDMEYQMDAAGEPVISSLKSVRTVDKQAPLDKAFYKTRVWGGLAAWGLGIVGLNLMGSRFHGVGKAMMVGAVGAGVANVVAGGHALATKRNDGDMPSFVMSIWDTSTMAALMVLRSRPGLSGAAINAMRVGSVAAGAASVQMRNEFGVTPVAGREVNVPASATRQFDVNEALQSQQLLRFS